MRSFLFHPLVYYPLVALAALAVILISLRPQSWPRSPEAHAGVLQDGAVVLTGEALGAPAEEPRRQEVYVARNGFGQVLGLRIAVFPGQPPPGDDEPGVRVLVEPETGARLSGKAMVAEVTVRPIEVTTAARLAVTLVGSGKTRWATLPLAATEQTLRYELAPTENVTAIGLRAVSDYDNLNYGVEIASIRLRPAGAAAQQN